MVEMSAVVALSEDGAPSIGNFPHELKPDTEYSILEFVDEDQEIQVEPIMKFKITRIGEIKTITERRAGPSSRARNSEVISSTLYEAPVNIIFTAGPYEGEKVEASVLCTSESCILKIKTSTGVEIGEYAGNRDTSAYISIGNHTYEKFLENEPAIRAAAADRVKEKAERPAREAAAAAELVTRRAAEDAAKAAEDAASARKEAEKAKADGFAFLETLRSHMFELRDNPLVVERIRGTMAHVTERMEGAIAKAEEAEEAERRARKNAEAAKKGGGRTRSYSQSLKRKYNRTKKVQRTRRKSSRRNY